MTYGRATWNPMDGTQMPKFLGKMEQLETGLHGT